MEGGHWEEKGAERAGQERSPRRPAKGAIRHRVRLRNVFRPSGARHGRGQAGGKPTSDCTDHYEEENAPIRLTDGHYGEIDICAVDTNDAEMIGKGKITIDSGAAESVLPQGMLSEVQLQQSEGSQRGVQYIAASRG